MTLNNSNCTIGVFNSSTDTTTDAFAIGVSPDNTTWYKWQLYTCTTSTVTLFTSFAIEGFRYARVVYSNGSGSDQTVEFDCHIVLELRIALYSFVFKSLLIIINKILH